MSQSQYDTIARTSYPGTCSIGAGVRSAERSCFSFPPPNHKTQREYPKSIVIVVMPPAQMLDISALLEVFRAANQLQGGEPPYSVRVVSAGSTDDVDSYSGSYLRPDLTYRECLSASDTLIISGPDQSANGTNDYNFTQWLRWQSARSRRICSVRTGAFVLAEVGLLSGRHATTHWDWCDELSRRYPSVNVKRDVIHVRHGNCYTSAGGSAAIDFALALVEEDCGSALASSISKKLIVFLRRPGDYAQISATLTAQSNERQPFSDLLAWLPDNLKQDLSVAKLASMSAMSPRNFARRFRAEFNITPAKHIEQLRLEAARRYIEITSLGMNAVAEKSGFLTRENLVRVFQRRFGITPRRYRLSLQASRLQNSEPLREKKERFERHAASA